MSIVIIIPTFKEFDNISILVKLILRKIVNTKVIIVDDSPTDEIRSLFKKHKKRVHYIFRKKKIGRGSAVLEGIKFALKKYNSKIFIEMDADLSHNPNEIKKNLRFFKKKKIDLLISSRYLKKSKIINWPIKRKILSYLSNKLTRFLLEVPITDYTNGFRIYSKNAAQHVCNNCGKIGDGFIILSEILVQLYYNNYKISETETTFINRLRGQSSVNFLEIFKSLIGLVKIFEIKQKLIKK